MARKLRLTGRDTFSGSLTDGVAVKRNQVILVRDAEGATLAGLMNRDADPDIAVFTTLTGSEPVTYDLTQNTGLADEFYDGSVTVTPTALAALPYRIPEGVLLRGYDKYPYGYSDGKGGFRSLVSKDGNLLVHPKYHCHYFAPDYFADQHLIADRSGAGNNAVNMSSFTSGVAGANAGYISTAASADAMWEIPDPSFDFPAGEALLLYWMLKHATNTASNQIIFGNGVAGSAPGLRITSVASAGSGTDYSVALFNASGVAASGTTSLLGANANALGNTLKTVAMYFDGQASKWSGWLNGALVRNDIALSLAGSSASASRYRVGGSQASATGTWATQTRMLAILKWGAQDAKPSTAAVTSALAKLSAMPGRLLTEADLP